MHYMQDVFAEPDSVLIKARENVDCIYLILNGVILFCEEYKNNLDNQYQMGCLDDEILYGE
jgi:hypothetical protein